MTRDEALAPLRATGARAITAFIVLNALAVPAVALVHGSANLWIATILAAAIAAMPVIMCLAGRIDAVARAVYALGIILFPILFVWLLNGDPWQMDLHMYFFVCFSMMVLLVDPRPILGSAGLVVVHHLLFFLVVPEWVFPGSGSIPRVLLHGFLVACEVGILLTAVRQISNLTIANQQDRADADAARQKAEAALEQSRQAEARAEREHRERLAAEAALKVESDTRRRATADEIESRVGQLVTDLRQIAERVARDAGSISTISRGLDGEANGLRASSELALEAIGKVSANSEELASSIREVGGNAQAARSVAEETAASISDLGPAIRILTSEVDAAQSILGLVSDIANRSNLLALNATIEAARGGEAGRGFTVVADEMKQMAQATGRAAAEIAHKLSGIIQSVDDFGGRIDWTITHVQEITANSAAIATSVEQQRVATDIIARSTDAVLDKVSETEQRSRTLEGIASDHRAIAQNAGALAEELGERATALSQRMDELLTELRAA